LQPRANSSSIQTWLPRFRAACRLSLRGRDCHRGELHRARVGPIIVNHEILNWIRHSRDEEVSMPDLPAESTIDPHAKALTGYITTWQG
jgi:hypothetical protein